MFHKTLGWGTRNDFASLVEHATVTRAKIASLVVLKLYAATQVGTGWIEAL
jgi:hypothetical protein